MTAMTAGRLPVRLLGLLVALITAAGLLTAATAAASAAGIGDGRIPVDPAPAAGRVFDGDAATTERLLQFDPTLAAVDISQRRFDAQRPAGYAVLSRDSDFADSLTGTALTGGGPLLLTNTDSLSEATATELSRVLSPGGTVYLLGGTSAISAAVEQQLRDLGLTPARLAGATRIETALAVADTVRALNPRSEVLLARATSPVDNPTAAWADSISAGGLAAAAGVPILLTPTEAMHPAVAAWLANDAPSLTVLLGGTSALSDAVQSVAPNPLRVSGAERTATAAAIASVLWGADATGDRRVVATNGERGDGWAFGLAAAGLSADAGAPILLATNQVTPATRGLASACGAPQVDLFLAGDGSVLSGLLREELDAYDGNACDAAGKLVIDPKLVPAVSCQNLLDGFIRSAQDRVGPYGLDGFFGFERLESFGVDDQAATDGSGAPAPAPTAQTGAGGGDADQAVSETNNQEAGVDEADFVKTDGRLTLAVAQGALQVVDLTGAAPTLASTVTLPEGYNHELFFDGTTALVFTQSAQDFGEPIPFGPGPADGPLIVEPAPEPRPATEPAPKSSPTLVANVDPQMIVTRIDLTTPASPRIIDTMTVDGEYRTARLIDGVARVVVTSRPAGFAFGYPSDNTLAALQDAAELNQAVVADSTLDNWLPQVRTGSGDSAGAPSPLVGCDRVGLPPWTADLGMTTVFNLALDGPLDPAGAAAVTSTAETVYASPTGLYVTSTRWENSAIDFTSDLVTTELHRFDISSPTDTRYIGSGSVPGVLLNQFSLSELDGDLRVAWTSVPPWQEDGTRQSESAVSVLRLSGDRLAQIGNVGGLGLGERIFAVRFLGDLAAVVTFRQTDPLYLVDLSDPTAPRVTGELKIPGFSAYLHRVNDGVLLGIGQDADADGRTTGSQVSLFDISNPAAPRRTAQLGLGDGNSEVEYDHRAFLYWSPTNLAVLPLASYSFDGRTAPFIGAVGVRVDPAAGTLSEAGRLSQTTDPNAPDGGFGAQIRRSIVVGDTLYTISESGLESADLATLTPRDRVEFEGNTP